MILVLKQTVVIVVVFMIGILLVLLLTFLTFPPDQINEIWSAHVYGFSYWMLVSILTISIGFISGITYALFWREKLNRIHLQLEELVRGKKVVVSNNKSLKEMIEIEQQIIRLERKLMRQAEVSQRLVTERANEREQSLQEVVIQERNRLARELHDSVSQQLFGASMLMSAINETSSNTESKLKKQLLLVENMIHQSQLEMRALLLHLRPVALKGKSLKVGIEELLKELTHKVPMTINWKVESFELDKGVEDHLFRILQESVSNSLRHASANSLQVILIKRDEQVILRVEDDGAGFKVDDVKSSSYGLQNMQERALEIGGTLKIVSVENQGTRLEVKVPYITNEG
ncbi:sensor histidine kinase [Bacillus pinisoli]|uniref:sensor histidine kinase n=1 Tax=Bacillus pinisoli TaxID=2901866 RepID=UPI001FF608AC|nr:sensor histidine kinase [Bacillus pinisoli]